MPEQEPHSVAHLIQELFPEGTATPVRDGRSPLDRPNYDEAPAFPADLFAIAALLLARGGAYHRVNAPETRLQPECDPTLDIAVTRDEHAHWCDIGREWFEASSELLKAVEATARPGADAEADGRRETEARNRLDAVRKRINTYWQTLYDCAAQPVVKRPMPDRLPWWKPALALLVIADEAAVHTGFVGAGGGWLNPAEAANRRINEQALAQLPPEQAVFRRPWDAWPRGGASDTFPVCELWSPDHLNVGDTLSTARSYVARVLPKSRTPAVGCTMRSLSHNLALLPPDGTVDFVWNNALPASSISDATLNLLLVPMPYWVEADCFAPASVAPAEGAATSGLGRDAPLHRHFALKPRWLSKASADTPSERDRDAVVTFLATLVAEARRMDKVVHGVVLPELALDWDTHLALVRALQEANAKLEDAAKLQFLVSGINSAPRMRKDGDKGELAAGNIVATTVFGFRDQEDGTKRETATMHWRHKHHRWRLDASQIEEYGLGGVLDPRSNWWEACEIPRRKVDVTLFRDGSVFSAMICEDLARIEPCHEPLRAIGPNLVFALLMDGPQLATRWPARYATVLADDPGSSVLSFTSLGLLQRTNRRGTRPVTRTVALWKDDSARGTIEIACPEGAAGILLNLAQHQAQETTLDGRPNTDARAWRYHGHFPVRLPETDEAAALAWVMKPR
ncbi:MAG: hypothetical protein K2X11_21415 [Acetobacteraceae bacterium]|nr:hypothetical protein [Acetobacteraceae bacterium]